MSDKLDPVPSESNGLLSLMQRGARVTFRNGYYIEGDVDEALMQIGYVRTLSDGQVEDIGIGDAMPITMPNLELLLAAIRRMAELDIKRDE